MICLRCNNKTFYTIPEARIDQEYKGLCLTVITPGVVCKNCGFICIKNNQLDSLVKNAKKTYQNFLKKKNKEFVLSHKNIYNM